MAERDKVHIQLCYALPEKAFVIDLDINVGSTIEEAIHHSGLLADYPDIDLDNTKIGVFGKLKTLDTLVREGDRIEIYRPLRADPMESRRRRAQHKKKGGHGQ